METKIIEIREELSNNKIRPGNFTLNLKQHLTLNDGDELNIRNIYIDSKNQSNTITINEDIILTMDICRGWCFNSDYIVHYGNTDSFLEVDDDKHIYLIKSQTATGTFINEDGGYIGGHDNSLDYVVSLNGVNSEGRGDTYTYYPVYRVPAPTSLEYKYLYQIIYSHYEYVNPYFGGFTAQFEYTNIRDEKAIFTIVLPPVLSSLNFKELDFTNGVLYKESDGFKLIHPSESVIRDTFNVDPNGFQFSGNDTDNNDILVPVTQKINIPIKAGNYQPSILAETINLELNKLNNKLNSRFNTTPPLTKNPPLFNDEPSIYDGVRVGQNADFYEASPNPANGINEYYHMVSEDDSNVILKIANVVDGVNNTVTNELMSGSQTFQFIFDEVTQTFKIENLHNPYYVTVGSGDNSSSAIGVNMMDFDVLNTGRIMTLNSKRGDFKIIGLTTNEKTGNFWYDKLGLNENVISTITTKLKDYQYITGELNVPNFNNNFNSDLGSKRTDALITNQVKLQNSQFSPNYISYNGDGATPSPLLLPTEDTISIFGEKTLNDIIVNDAYFKVIINGSQFSNKLYDEEGIKLISAIVGKYYSGESYTNGFSSDGITYTHRGAPITLSNFNINILSSKNEIPIIGSDNTLIIQVNKQIIAPSNKE